MGKKVALALSLLATAAVLSACGGTGSGSEASTGNRGLAVVEPSKRHTDPRKSCNAQGINRTQLGTGACTEDGVHYVVENYGGIVNLKTLGVGIVGVSVAPADQGHGRTVRPQREAFLRVTLQVQNRDKVAHRFALGQTMFGVGQDDYPERTDVERDVHVESLAATNGGRIGPGETLRGDVIFDITEGDYAQIQRRGRFFIWNFGDKASPQLRRGSQLGEIRLYAIERGAVQQRR